MLIGEILLTIVLISGSYHLSKAFAPQDIQKAVFSFLAWIVFGSALVGHWKLHWRGKKSGVLCAFRYHSPDYRLFW
ncbi:inner membrane protein YpjD [Pasteurella multocida]|nr:inner membrane protein YpjD [Pasteurella multocida]